MRATGCRTEHRIGDLERKLRAPVPRGADVWARSAFRLRGSLAPRNGRAIYLRDRQGCRNFTRSKGGWDRRGARSCTPDGLGYALIPSLSSCRASCSLRGAP